ncbi:MAG: SIS domain-containing protein [Candidatus Aenigmarchaeota archaeon]|nr:SIS domain-containing protein [Candidatus Aenigmarchaeota archaeon]
MNIEEAAVAEIKSVKSGDAIKVFTKDYIDKLKGAFDSLPIDKIEGIADILLGAYEKGNYVYIMGNGGSAATAAHMVCDLAKGTIWPVAPGEKRFRIACLSDNTPLLTAWTNDIDYSQVFREQILNLVGKGDVVIGISGSGNSMNVINAVEYANSCGAMTVGLTGCGGGKLKDVVKECIVVESNNMERVEDVHHSIAHMIKTYVNLKLNMKGLV